MTGIRSEYYILYPVLEALRNDPRFELKVVVCGAHLSDWHGNTLQQIEAAGFVIADKIDNLLMTNRVTQRAKGVGLLTYALSQTVEREAPDFLFYIGDREEAISCGIVGNYMNVLFAHLGGGDPVFGNADDPIRFATSKLAHLHFTTAQSYADNLLKIGEESFRVFNTGNPALDTIRTVPTLSLETLSEFLKVDITNTPFITFIKHPLSSEKEDAGTQMSVALAAVDQFCADTNTVLIGSYPNTDPGSYDSLAMMDRYTGSQRLHFYKTLPSEIFVNVMRHSLALVGNSSMGILEAPFYKLPVVNIGNRQLGRLNAGNVEFVPYDIPTIVDALKKACFDPDYRRYIHTLSNPYGDGASAEKIRDILAGVDTTDPKWYTKKALC